MDEKLQKKRQMMLETPIPRLIPTLAVPTIISMLVTAFYNMADTFFVGRLSTEATAAVGVVFSMMALMQAFGFLYGHGSGVSISRDLGENQIENANKMAANGFYFAIFTGLIIFALGSLFIDPILRILGATETILPHARGYLRVILVGAPFIMSSFVMNNQLRYQGLASRAMIGMTFGAVLNIVLDPILMFGLDLGVTGAALATVISQFISFLLLVGMYQRSGILSIRLQNFKPTLTDTTRMVKDGFPSLCRQGLASIATMSMNLMAGPFGDAAIAAMSIVGRVMFFASSVMIGWGQGYQPVCGFSYGAKRYDRVREGFFFCAKTAAVFLCVIAAVGFAFSPQIAAIFRDDPAVIQAAARALRAQFLTLPLMSIIILTNMMLQSIGAAGRASVLALGRQGLFFLPVIWVLPGLIGLDGVLLAQPIADVLSFLFAAPMCWVQMKELKKPAPKG